MRLLCEQCELRSCKSFRPVTAEQLSVIQSVKRDHRALPAGSTIISAGAECPEMFTLYSGWAFRFKTLADGRRQILNFLLPGDLLGLQAAMFAAASHGIEALTDVEVCVLPRRKVWELFEDMPELAFDVTWLGSREESIVDENLASVGRRTAEERIAALLIMLFRRAELIGMVDGHSLEFPPTQQHIADALGLSLVHTNKTLGRLHRLGMFKRASIRGRTFSTLSDPQILARFAQYFEREVPLRPLI